MIRGTCKVGDIVWIGHEHAPSFKRWKLRWECPAGLFLGLSPDGKCRVRLGHETRDMPLDEMYNYEQLAYESVQRAEHLDELFDAARRGDLSLKSMM